MATLTETRSSVGVWTYGIWVLALAALIAFAVSIYNFFNMSNGIHGTEGALLVVISTALMLSAALVISVGWARARWVYVLLEILIVLDILGTGLAGYLLESWALVGLMAIALIAWLVHIVSPTSHRARA